jgi:LPXTG-site transpeptidase (sortase) family protein
MVRPAEIMTTSTTNTLHGTPVRSTKLVLRTAATFCVVSLVLVAVDLVPEPVKTEAESVVEATSTLPVFETADVRIAEPAVPEAGIPVRIEIPTIGVDTAIVSPASTDVDVLDRALLSGAVHYPDSAELSVDGNMLIFGHSSYLPVVQNKAYQAFNELSELNVGEKIVVHSDTHVHTYTVKQVRLVRAGDAQIVFASDRPMLTLATCNTFGAKQDRWVVTAEWITKEPITSS